MKNRKWDKNHNKNKKKKKIKKWRENKMKIILAFNKVLNKENNISTMAKIKYWLENDSSLYCFLCFYSVFQLKVYILFQ